MKPLGIQFAANVALMIARDVTGKVETSDRRDHNGVRQIACVLLRETGVSYPDIAGAVYGKRSSHGTVHEHVMTWQSTPQAAEAMGRWVPLLEDYR